MSLIWAHPKGEMCLSTSGPTVSPARFRCLTPSPSSKRISSLCSPARAWPSPAPRENCEARSPNCRKDSSGNSAACTPRAGITSARSLRFSPSQDQPSVALSTAAFPLGVLFCPLPESTGAFPPVTAGGRTFPMNNWRGYFGDHSRQVAHFSAAIETRRARFERG